MANKSKIEGFENIDQLFRQLARPQDFCEVAVGEAAPILLKSAKESVHKAIYQPPTPRKGARKDGPTGKLERSFMASKPKTNAYGSFSSIQPVGYREDKTVSKGKKLHYSAQAAFLEWGTNEGQAPSPWRARAIKDAEAECADAMEKTVIREVNKFWEVEDG